MAAGLTFATLLSGLLAPNRMANLKQATTNAVKRSAAVRRHGNVQLSGEWVLDTKKSSHGALRPFLIACGAPRVFAGPLARKFDSDHLVLKAEGDEITIETPRSGWSLPIKLQTDATYSRHKETIVATPRGPQRASLVTASHAPMAVEIIKLGPSEGEFVTEHYVTTDDGNLEQQLTHRAADGRTEVVVRRVFKRVTSV